MIEILLTLLPSKAAVLFDPSIERFLPQTRLQESVLIYQLPDIIGAKTKSSIIRPESHPQSFLLVERSAAFCAAAFSAAALSASAFCLTARAAAALAAASASAFYWAARSAAISAFYFASRSA